jgi:hypothetical protein
MAAFSIPLEKFSTKLSSKIGQKVVLSYFIFVHQFSIGT